MSEENQADCRCHAAIIAAAAIIVGEMPRTDVYIKVTVDHGEDEAPDRLGKEICRQVEKVYGVRTAEVQNFVTRTPEL